MRLNCGVRVGVRSSALWGTGKGGDHRSRKDGKRGSTLVAIVALALVLPALAGAKDRAKTCESGGAYIPQVLLHEACTDKNAHLKVIVQGDAAVSSSAVGSAVKDVKGVVKVEHRSVTGVYAKMTGAQILGISHNKHILAITPNEAVVPTGYEDAEMWRDSTSLDELWTAVDPATGSAQDPLVPPAIAVVDTGVAAAEDFGDRLRAEIVLCALCADGATGDDYGHGTMVATVAAGGAAAHRGAAPRAPIVSIRTADGEGRSYVSDVIAAADWILANKGVYDIRVANFSLSSGRATSFRVDPLNKAVERLWLAGVVVVAAVGNHGSADGPVRIKAPASDPFVITVGALDQHRTAATGDDTRPAWSAYGRSLDGFAKPDLAAPGRYMIGRVPAGATLPRLLPTRVVGPGYMWMSGTSFAAPVVAGAAAQLLARHPEWGPDDVKGALMQTAQPVATSTGVGVGEIDAAAAAAVSAPPNPNANLYEFVAADVTGMRAFNAAAWAAHVAVNRSWTISVWPGSGWSESGWSESAWSESAWSESAWSESSWDE